MYTRLNKLGMCVSHKTVLRFIKKLGKNHDKAVMQWKEGIEGRMSVSTVSEQSPDDDSEASVSMSSESEESVDFMNPDDFLDGKESQQRRYILTGDNIDKNITPRDMRTDYQTQSLHYFHAYADLNRIDFTALREETPTSRLLRNLEILAFLPSVADCQALRDNYVVLFARVICDTLSTLYPFQKSVPRHILHKYSVNMSAKSVTVSLTLLLDLHVHFTCLIVYTCIGAIGCYFKK